MLPSSMSKVTQQLPCVLASYLLFYDGMIDIGNWFSKQWNLRYWYLCGIWQWIWQNWTTRILIYRKTWIVDCKWSVTSCIILTGTNRSWESENGGSRKVIADACEGWSNLPPARVEVISSGAETTPTVRQWEDCYIRYNGQFKCL